MIRVANIIEEGRFGGPQNRILLVAHALQGQVETTIIMPALDSEEFQKKCNEMQINFLLAPITRMTKEWKVAVRYIFFLFFEVVRLSSILKKEKFDLVHISGGAWQFKGVIAAVLARKKILWHINDSSSHWFIRKMFSVLSSMATGFVFSSDRARKYYQPYMPDTHIEFVIPPPVDTQYYNPSQDFDLKSSVLKGYHGKFVVGIVANVNPVKDLASFLKAAALVNQKFSDVNFVIIGALHDSQKKYFAHLNQLCEELNLDNVDFLGFLTDTREWLQRMDCYICSSVSETGPMTLWEAMSMSKPVISTNVGDVSLYIKDGVNGYIVDVGDYNNMADRVERLIMDENMRESFGIESRETAVGNLDIASCAMQHIKAYQSIMHC